MNDDKTKKRVRRTTASRKSAGRGKKVQQRSEPLAESKPKQDPSLIGKLADMTQSAFRFASKTTETSLRVGRALFLTPERQKMMEEAGKSLRDLRMVTGLTINELSESLDIKDKSILEAVENGTSTLSFDLILRLSSLLARHDPVPFIIKYTRTYDPTVWEFLQDWGVGRLPLQYERERKFINIYRGNDDVRKLDDDEFDRLIAFTQASFNLAANFLTGPQEDADEEDDEDEVEEESEA